MEILPNIHQIDAGGSNAYLLFEFDGITLIDTGFVGTVEQILGVVKALGKVPGDVKQILLTHRHPDHVGGAAGLRRATGAKVWAPQPDAQAISENPSKTFPVAPVGLLMRQFAGASMTPVPCPVDETLVDGAVLPIMGGLKVIWTPGHTFGHCSLYHPQQRVLFAGDAVTTLFGSVRVSFPFVCDDYAEACRTIRDRLKPLPIDHVLAGHGKPLATNVGANFARLATRYAGL